MKELAFSIVFLIYSISAGHKASTIVELGSMEGIEKYITTKNPLVLVDVHHTLIKYRKKYEQLFKSDERDDFKLKWFFIKPVEKNASAIIKRLQKKYNVLILTKCKSLLDYYKFYQLHTLGLDFSKTFSYIPSYYIKKNHFPAFFNKGLICSGKGNKKGDILILFLLQNNINPTQIIFIDDGLENIKSVQKAAKELDIPFVGIWYTRVDRKELHAKN